MEEKCTTSAYGSLDEEVMQMAMKVHKGEGRREKREALGKLNNRDLLTTTCMQKLVNS